METNLEKAKRLLKENAKLQGIELPEDGFMFKMLDLAATPDGFSPYTSFGHPQPNNDLPVNNILGDYNRCPCCGHTSVP